MEMESMKDIDIKGSKRGSRGKRPARMMNPDEELSRALSWALRHAAPSLGLTLSSDGYVSVEDIISCQHKRFKKKGYTLDDVRRVVENNDKKRFRLQQMPSAGAGASGDDADSLGWFIRANQGHSLSTVETSALLTPIDPEELAQMDTIVHGTNRNAWEKHIRQEGLNRMKRNHIHFAAGPANEMKSMEKYGTGISGDMKEHTSQMRVISGMRKGSQIHLYVDSKLCVRDSVLFFRSDNDVILTSGVNNEGTLPLKYISRVIDAHTNEILYENRGEDNKGEER